MKQPNSSRRAGTRSAKTLATLATLAVATATLAACSASPSTPAAGTGSASAGAPTGTITVLAAASLTEPFTTLARQFEAAHPGTTVTLSFGGSSTLAAQITAGSPADVFASASTTDMGIVTQAKLAATPSTFTTNLLTIAVPPGNPAHITGVADLAKAGVKVAVCQPAVPCGVLATSVFAKAGVTVTPASLEPDVKAVLTKVTLGEVDAGLVYVTDVRSAKGKADAVTIPAGVDASTDYPIAVLTGAPNPVTAQAFVDYVLSPAGRAVMTADGFGAP